MGIHAIEVLARGKREATDTRDGVSALCGQAERRPNWPVTLEGESVPRAP